MTSDSSVPSPEPIAAETKPEIDLERQVRFKSEAGRLLLLFPLETTNSGQWSDIWQQLKQRLDAGERFWQPDTEVTLVVRERLLDARQLQAIAEALSQAKMQLKSVATSRRQTAVAAATAGYSVEQQTVQPIINPKTSMSSSPAEPLYLETTVRSGVEIRHPGTVIIMGDLNPGGSVIAAGDILVWGRLRGVVHAGAAGNSQCVIMALQMEPTQIRIADYVARSPETPPAQVYPEVAYVTTAGIRIARAMDFSKTNFRSQS